MAGGWPIMRIRPPTQADAPALVAAVQASLPELLPWMPWCHAAYDLAAACEWIDLTTQGLSHEFIIEADGVLVGACGLNRIDPLNHIANLGYWLATPHVGRGLVTGAVRELIDWAFANTRLVRLEIVVAEANARSLRVAERVGAVREALLAKRVFANGEPSAAWMFAVLRRD